jgi:LacI family transcriptional regulator
MPVTLQDIATKLGLSIAAVSRALGGFTDISEETRKKVIQTAQEMGYSPNQAARQLRRNKSDSIGYILPAKAPRFADPFFTEFLVGLSDETAEQPFDLLISIAPPGEEAEQDIYRKWIQSHKVDGMILTHIHLHDWRAQFLTKNNVPFTAIENSYDGLDYPRIEVNRQSGMIKLINHLVENGFYRIAYIGGPPDLKIQVDQFDGYCRGLDAHKFVFDNDLVVTGDLTSSSGYNLSKQLLSLPEPPDAIVCINDETAFGVLHTAHELGWSVGEDLGVAGFNGVQAACHSEPPLTSLDIPVYDIARTLVKMLVTEISGQPINEKHVTVEPQLLLRASTGD